MKNFLYQLLMFIFAITQSMQIFAADNNAIKSDEYYMQRAVELAKQNLKKPFGAVIVDNKTGEIIAEGVNDSKANPTFHGEMVAINDCAQKHPGIDWSNVSLYTTGEPCPMCQSAIIWAGISKVVYATSIPFLKAHGWDQIDIDAKSVNAKAKFYKGKLIGGVLANQTDPMFVKAKEM